MSDLYHLTCPLCACRVATGDAEFTSGDCQCSRERLVRKIISMQSAVIDARAQRDFAISLSRNEDQGF